MASCPLNIMGLPDQGACYVTIDTSNNSKDRESSRTLRQELPKSKPWKRSRSMRVSMMMKHRRMRWQQRHPKARSIASSIVIAFLLLMVMGASAGSAYAYKYYQDQLPRVQGLANQQISQTSRIYDRNGALLYEAYDNSHVGGRRRSRCPPAAAMLKEFRMCSWCLLPQRRCGPWIPVQSRAV